MNVEPESNPKVSIFIARFLKEQGIKSVFELSGGMIMDMIDSLYLEGGIEIVNVHHEQSAAFAADAIGRLSGRPGVALATSGPGAINLLTGIGSCFFDSSPAVFITGQVKRNEQRLNPRQRQAGFQETDIVTMAGPIVKWAYRVTDPSEVPGVMVKAFEVAMEGRPGPVLIDIPMDVFRARIEGPNSTVAIGTQTTVAPCTQPIVPTSLVNDLRASKKPLILIGGGVRASGAFGAFQRLVNLAGIPVVYSLLAVDVLDFDHPNHVGMIGTYGNRWANIAISEADFLLVLGSRLDIRQTGADVLSFKGPRPIYHVDVDELEINSRVKGCIPIVSELLPFLTSLIETLQTHTPLTFPDWQAQIKALHEQWPDIKELDVPGINPNILMHELSRNHHPAAYCVDVGNHQMWAAQSLEIHQGQRFLTSGGMGAMGFALPAAIGAAIYLEKNNPIVVIAGDGGFQLSLHELQTVVRNHLPIKMVVINNGCHGMTRQFQDSYFEGRYQGTVWGYDAPDFEAVGKGYQIPAATVRNADAVCSAIAAMWEDPLAPYLLQVMVGTHVNVFPKIAFGKPMSEMEPFASPIEMEGT